MSISWNNVTERALWTFVQAFVASLLVSLMAFNSFTTLKASAYSAVVAALAAGVSATKTFVQEALNQQS